MYIRKLYKTYNFLKPTFIETNFCMNEIFLMELLH